MSKSLPQKGDTVTTRRPVEINYAGYAGLPRRTFRPGDRAIVFGVAMPYVYRSGTFYAARFHDGPCEYTVAIDSQDVRVLCK